MKKGWQTKKLGDVCATIQDGAHESPKRQFDSPGKGRFLYITSKNIRNNYLDLDNVSYVEEDFHNRIYPRCGPSVGDVLLTKDGANTGNVTLNTLDEPFSLLSSVCLIKTKPDALQPAFLSYYIQSPDGLKSITGQMTGAAIKRIILRDIKLAEMPLPPLAEQQRIVGLLDEAFAGLATAKANAEKNLQNARALFESRLQSVFTQRGKGWVENKLKSVTTKIGSGATPRGGEESYKTEGISLIRSLNVHDLGFKYAKLAFLDDTQAGELSNVEVQPRDVLLNITGASVARCCIVPDDVLPARVNQHVSIIRPIAEKLDPDFLHYLLISKPYKDLLLQTGEEGGSTRQAITKAQIQDFSVEYPATLKEQKVIAGKLDALREETQRLATLYERKLAALEALKKSLLHQAFTGELKNEGPAA
jgi:type I restriction enzyme S subunit